jgi:hypothetical protein
VSVWLTVASWILIGFVLNFLGVFDGNDNDPSEISAGAPIADLRLSPLTTKSGAEPDADKENFDRVVAKINAECDGKLVSFGGSKPRSEIKGNPVYMSNGNAALKDQSADKFAGAEIVNVDFGNPFFSDIEGVAVDARSRQEKMFADSTLVRNGSPTQIDGYDESEDAILFGYDPILTPDPKIELVNGNFAGDKVLLMNGTPVITFAASPDVTLSDINVFELPQTA